MEPFLEREDGVDPSLYTDLLAAVYRYTGPPVKDELFPKCLTARSEAVRLCAVDAILTLIIEVAKSRLYFNSLFIAYFSTESSHRRQLVTCIRWQSIFVDFS